MRHMIVQLYDLAVDGLAVTQLPICLFEQRIAADSHRNGGSAL